MNKILYLTLKKKWFEMIASGEKIEEYREIKPYWVKRLLNIMESYNEYKEFDKVIFRNGYSKGAPSMTFRILYIDRGYGHPKWGAPKDRQVFRIFLGERIK